MCNSIFNSYFCVVFHCSTYELYRLFSIQIVINIGLYILDYTYNIILLLLGVHGFIMDFMF